MTGQEVFNMLSALEEYFYYRMHNPDGIPFHIVNQMHDEVNTALIQWHNFTGCRNE